MLIDGLEINEGSVVTNLTIPTGTSFPVDKSNGELFYRTDSPNIGFYVYDSTTLAWAQLSDGTDALGGGSGGSSGGVNKNYVINSNFDIWQRSISHLTTGSGFAADRFRHSSNGGAGTASRQAFTVGQSDVPNNPKYYFNFSMANTPSLNPIVEQRIENVSTLAGESATLSFYAKSSGSITPSDIVLEQNFGTGGSASIDISANETITALTTSFVKYTYTFTIPSISGKTVGTNNYLSLRFDLPVSTFSFDLAQIKLEKGTSATDYEPKSLGEELLDCQRYYNKTYNLDSFPGTATTSSALGVVSSGVGAVSFMINWEYEVEMRTAPSITVYNHSSGATGTVHNGGGGGPDLAVGTIIGQRNTIIYNSSTNSLDREEAYAHATADAEL